MSQDVQALRAEPAGAMALRLVLAFAVSLWLGCSLCRETEGMCGPQGLEGVLAERHCLRTGLVCRHGIFWVG